MYRRPLLVFVLWAIVLNGLPDTVRAEEDVLLKGSRYQAAFSRENGSLRRLSQDGKPESIFSSGECGLWQARLAGDQRIDAASFSAASTERSFRWSRNAGEGSLSLHYQGPEMAVQVTVTGHAEGVDFAAEITPRAGTVEEFALPARVRFRPERLERLVCPADGNQSVGTAFLGSFFQPQPQQKNWKPQVIGNQGCQSLFGLLGMRPDRDPAVEIRVTAEGGKWLGSSPLPQTVATVNRPIQAGKGDLVLVESAHGPYFSARLVGEGRLWRIGGWVGAPEEQLATNLVARTVQRLAASRPAGRDKIGLLALRNGPVHGSWTSVSVAEWNRRLSSLPAVTSGKLQFVALGSVEETARARAGREFLAILNPYGEWLPVAKAGEMAAAVASIGKYARDGGNWFEVGGYPFFCELLPADSYFDYAVGYPPAFADFFHFQTQAGAAAVYRIQPRNWAPWAGAKDPHAIFIPGRIACGGDEKGGWCERPFVTWVPAGSSWRCPTVRIAVGESAAHDLRAYAKLNGIERRLEDKMPPDVLAKFKRSVLLYYAGPAAEKRLYLDLLPSPCQLHFADYLQGGFDKQYPDHLPPSPRFGTPQQFREFLDAAHQRGHLVIPYTNPTWWCDEPKGPTFLKAGEEPLLHLPSGKLSAERYGDNSGFTICHWHPAVQEANRRTRRQFHEEYPVDVLFQDQCGARGSCYDLNKASPAPYAYTEGLLSMIDEDSRRMPLSTESGWDRVVNAESQLCGMTWSIVPTQHAPAWRQLMRHRYAPGTWEIFPLAQYLAHDKTAMLHHDLGQFVTNRQVLAWTLGLGFSMSDRAAASALREDAPRQWLLWLDRIQKSVCSRYLGQALEDFQHDRGPRPGPEDDGVLRATYGGALRIVANLDPRPRQESGYTLAGYGFCITGPDLVAANLALAAEPSADNPGASFVVERRAGGDGQDLQVWLYAVPGEDAAFVLPVAVSKPVTLALDGDKAAPTVVERGVHRLRLPATFPGATPLPSGTRVPYLWHGIAKIPHVP